MSATVDTTKILLEEYARLTDSDNLLPEAVAAHGAAGIANDVAKILQERNQQRFTEAQYRSAIRECFRRLMDDRGDIADRSPNLANRVSGMDAEAEIQTLHEATLIVLGKDDFSDEEYTDALLAVVDARASSVKATAEGDQLTPGQAAQLRGDVLHQFALQHLRERGIFPEQATADQYAEAIGVAEQVLDEKGGV